MARRRPARAGVRHAIRCERVDATVSAPMLSHQYPLQACSSRVHDARCLNIDALVTLQAVRW